MKIEQTVLDSIRARPRFKIYTSLSRQDYTAHLIIFLAENTAAFSGNINTESATITVKTDEDDYWKPTLSLRAETEDNTTVIRGIFGPSAAVWTFFMFLYFIFSMLWMVFFTVWFVALQVGSTDFGWDLPASLGMLILLMLTYLASLFGQRKARAQMTKLRWFAEESIRRMEH